MGSDDALQAYYERGEELERLDSPIGRVEFDRSTEIVARHLTTEPAVIADIGGGPGRYAAWLARLGHRVHHRDIVPLHVEQARAAFEGLDIDTALGDATDVDLPDRSVDAVLMLGPLYHLPRRADRLRALTEARRIVRPGGLVFVAAISRWSARLHAVLAERLYLVEEGITDRLADLERTGLMPPLFAGSFIGFSHRPDQLRREVRDAGLELRELVNVEGPAALLVDLEDRLADPTDRAIVLDTVRAVERVPELIGVGPHLLAVASRHDLDSS
jgi:SAM-dependent methyltransferase